jgi:hypothetical protein
MTKRLEDNLRGPSIVETLKFLTPIYGDIKFWEKLKEPGIIMSRGGKVNDENRAYFFGRVLFMKYLAYAVICGAIADTLSH